MALLDTSSLSHKLSCSSLSFEKFHDSKMREVLLSRGCRNSELYVELSRTVSEAGLCAVGRTRGVLKQGMLSAPPELAEIRISCATPLSHSSFVWTIHFQHQITVSTQPCRYHPFSCIFPQTEGDLLFTACQIRCNYMKMSLL